jgi:hypothetical protein
VKKEASEVGKRKREDRQIVKYIDQIDRIDKKAKRLSKELRSENRRW